MGQHPQLDLGIIRGQKETALFGNERAAKASADRPAGRDVLEVRIGAGEAAGRGHGLIVGRVDPAVGRVDQGRESVGVRGLELGRLAVFDDEGNNRMGVPEVVENVDRRRDGFRPPGFFRRRGEAASERGPRKAGLGRIDVELEAGVFVDLFFQTAEIGFEFGRNARRAASSTRTPAISISARILISGRSRSR